MAAKVEAAKSSLDLSLRLRWAFVWDIVHMSYVFNLFYIVDQPGVNVVGVISPLD